MRAERVRAIIGRQCPHSGEGEDFLTRRPVFLYKNGHNSGTKSQKLPPRWEMNNGLSEGYKRGIDQNLGRMAKIGFFVLKRTFWAQKKAHFLILTMFWPQSERVVQRKKLPLSK